MAAHDAPPDEPMSGDHGTASGQTSFAGAVEAVQRFLLDADRHYAKGMEKVELTTGQRVFGAAPHVEAGEFGLGPFGFTSREDGHPEFWHFVVRHPHQPRGEEEWRRLRSEGDPRGDYDPWEADEEYVFDGNPDVAAYELAKIVVTEFASEERPEDAA